MGRKDLGNYSVGRKEKKSMASEGHKANVTFLEDKVDFFFFFIYFLLAMVSREKNKCFVPIVLNSDSHIVVLLN